HPHLPTQHTRTHTHTHTHHTHHTHTTHIHTQTYIQTHTHIFTHTYLYTHTHTFTHTHIHLLNKMTETPTPPGCKLYLPSPIFCQGALSPSLRLSWNILHRT